MIRLALADQAHHPPIHEEIARAVESAAAAADFACERLRDPGREGEFDVVLMLGHPQFYPAFLRQRGATRRLCWYGENLPPAAASPAQALLRRLPSARMLDVAHDIGGRATASRTRRWILAARERAAIEREWGRNVRRLRAARRWVDELVVTSSCRSNGARLAGWHARWVPFGYQAEVYGPLVPPETPRDIDVLFIGRDVFARGRRARWLAEFKRRSHSSFSLTVVDAGLYGSERQALLARTKVVLDINRVPGNPAGLRYVMATAGGAAMVSEASDDDWLPDGGASVVEAPVDELHAAVERLLEDEERRRELVNAGQRILGDELAMTTCLRRVVMGAGYPGRPPRIAAR